MSPELCAMCGTAIPYFTADCDDATDALSEFDTLDDGRVAHRLCLDGKPLPVPVPRGQVEMFA